MPSNKALTGPIYSILFEGTHEGTAFELLDWIRKRAASKSLRDLTTEKYAKLLIADAPYFLPEGLLRALDKKRYASEFDKALWYLSEMPSSGVRILATMEVTS